MSNPQKKLRCGDVVTTLSALEARQYLQENEGKWFEDSALQRLSIEGITHLMARNGIEVRKLCGSCSSMMKDAKSRYLRNPLLAPTLNDFCGDKVYGSNATFSGLLITPYNDQTRTIQAGNLTVSIWCHATAFASYNVPSEWWAPLKINIFPAILGAVSGAVTIIPDFMGFGESEELFKSLLMKRPYQTSSIPLWHSAKQLIATATDGKTVLDNGVVLSGYSEGGYAAVSLAEAFSKMGVKIIALQDGAGPVALSSVQMPAVIRNDVIGRLSHVSAPTIMRMCSSYSLANPSYGQRGIGLLNTNYDVDLVDGHLSEDSILDIVGDDESPITAVNPSVVEYIEDGLQRHDNDLFNLCHGDLRPSPTTSKLCEALELNELRSFLESSTFPIRFCHSRDDEIAPMEGLPNWESNPFMTLKVVSGRHKDAAAPCMKDFAFFLASLDQPWWEPWRRLTEGEDETMPRHLYSSHETSGGKSSTSKTQSPMSPYGLAMRFPFDRYHSHSTTPGERTTWSYQHESLAVVLVICIVAGATLLRITKRERCQTKWTVSDLNSRLGQI